MTKKSATPQEVLAIIKENAEGMKELRKAHWSPRPKANPVDRSALPKTYTIKQWRKKL